jgi:Sec7-like guanine-nucleotide exchange factor
MEVGLPRETQQIDRVIEAFAFRYTQCNPDFFLSEGEIFSLPLFSLFIIQNSFKDHAYVLAFSLIMLHTDAFNPSNKRKMTKEDYTKNTKLPGVPMEVLDVSYNLFMNIPWLTYHIFSISLTTLYSPLSYL